MEQDQNLPPELRLPTSGSTVVQYFDQRPNYRKEKEKDGFDFKEYMYKQIMASALNPMMGMGFLDSYSSSNPLLAGLQDGSFDNIYGL